MINLGTVLEPDQIPGSRVPGITQLPGSGTGNRGKPKYTVLIHTERQKIDGHFFSGFIIPYSPILPEENTLGRHL